MNKNLAGIMEFMIENKNNQNSYLRDSTWNQFIWIHQNAYNVDWCYKTTMSFKNKSILFNFEQSNCIYLYIINIQNCIDFLNKNQSLFLLLVKHKTSFQINNCIQYYIELIIDKMNIYYILHMSMTNILLSNIFIANFQVYYKFINNNRVCFSII